MNLVGKRLLLLSNSSQHGRGYLDHAETEVRDLLRSRSRVLFVPYALKNLDGYAEIARKRFETMGYQMESVHRSASPRTAVESTEALFIGGGNTFRLLKMLCENQLLEAIRQRVAAGMPYMGASAGTVVACPTIRTTNDMPIVEPPSLTALGLVPFQINPHYLDPDPNSTFMGETRETRLMEFHEENTVPVFGLREGDMLRIGNGSVLHKGTKSIRIFRQGQEPVEAPAGSTLDSYLGLSPQR